MNAIDPRYLQLADAIGSHPDYLAIPPQDRPACQRLMLLTGATCSDPDDIAAAYAPALDEVRGLIARGLLPGLVLPDSVTVMTAPAEQPVVVEQAQGAAGAAGPAVLAALGVAANAPDTNGDATAVLNPEHPTTTEEPHPAHASAAPAVRAAPGAAAVAETLTNDDAPAQAVERTRVTEPEAHPVVVGKAERQPEPSPAPAPKSKGRRSGGTKPDRSGNASQDGPATRVADGDDWTELPGHPLAAIFPMMSKEQLEAHAQDIKTNGQQTPVFTFQGTVVDGRNTQAACRIVRVKPRYEEWDGKGSLLTFILSRNLHRRNLNDQQRALVAVRIKAALEAEAIERRNANLLQNKGSTDGLDPGHRSDGRSAEVAASALRVSRDAVNKAAKVIKDGSPELVVAVEQQAVSLDAAALVATLPADEQREIVAQDKVKAKAKELREAKKAGRSSARAKTAEEDDNEEEQPSDEKSATQAETKAAPVSDAQQAKRASPSQTKEADAENKPTAGATQPAAPKLRIKQVIDMAEQIAGQKPILAPEIIQRAANAANLTVAIVEDDARKACRELARLLRDKLEDLASDNYEEASALLTSIDEELWNTVNAHAPEEESGELIDE